MNSIYNYIPGDLWRASRLLQTVPVEENDDNGGNRTQLVFDKSSLAFTCLKGCVYMVNKSNAHYTSVLLRTLREDYGIPVTFKVFAHTDAGDSDDDGVGKLSRDLDRRLRMRDADRGNALMQTEACTRLISLERGKELHFRQRRGDEMTDVERQQLWVYHMVVERYHLPVAADAEIDTEVLEKYVGPCIPKTGSEAMLRQYYALKRLDKLYESTTMEARGKYLSDVQAVTCMHNSAMELHETKLHNYYKPMIEVGELLDQLDPQWRVSMVSGVVEGALVLPISNKALLVKLVAWLQGMSNDKYADVMGALGIELRSDSNNFTRASMLAALSDGGGGSGGGGSGGRGSGGRGSSGGSGSKPKANTRPGRTATEFLETLITRAFGMCLVPPALSKKGYRNIDPRLYTDLRRRRNTFGVYSFIDDEDPTAPEFNGLVGITDE